MLSLKVSSTFYLANVWNFHFFILLGVSVFIYVISQVNVKDNFLKGIIVFYACYITSRIAEYLFYDTWNL